jgi:hypothetical protein
MSDVVVRDNYFDRQVLRTQDFTDEQAYHLAMRRKHNLGGHSWGVVHGLELVVTDGSPYLNAGLAVDGYGRELVVTEPLPVPVNGFAELNRSLLDVMLVYGRRGSDLAPPGYAGCDDDGVLFYRWVETPTLRLQVPPEDDPPDRRAPPDVPTGDHRFPPSRLPPDDPEREWPVLVGQLRYDPSKPDAAYVPDISDRPYAGLVGERLEAPSGRARVQVGAEREDDPRRFAVWIEDPARPGELETDPRLAIGSDGNLQVRGDAECDGQLTVGRAVQLGAGGPPPAAAPWSIYLVQDNGQPTTLRVEIPNRALGGPANQFAVGRWSEDAPGGAKFQPCLTVGDDCTVTVAGDLLVQGTLVPEGAVTAGNLGPDARRMLLSSYLGGVGGAGILLGRYYRSPFPEPSGPNVVEALAPVLLADESGLREVARTLAESTAQRAAFAAVVQERYPQLAAALGADLARARDPGPEGERRDTAGLREGETAETGLAIADVEPTARPDPEPEPEQAKGPEPEPGAGEAKPKGDAGGTKPREDSGGKTPGQGAGGKRRTPKGK